MDSYLGELDEGNVRTVNRSETQTSNGSFGFQLDTIGNATVSQGKQLTISAVVSKTEADNFYTLLEQLHESSLTTVSTESLNLVTQLSPSLVPDGAMVRIENAFVQLPPYLSAYPLLRYARFKTQSKAFEPPPLTEYKLARYTSGAKAEKARASFIEKVGPNPRLPFTLSVPERTIKQNGRIVKEPPLTIVIPARYADLTGDPSLLYARLTVVGKLVFNGYHGFGDGASEDTYLPALLKASPSLLRELGVRRSALHSKKALFEGLSQSLTYPGRVVEVVPIAMYD